MKKLLLGQTTIEESLVGRDHRARRWSGRDNDIRRARRSRPTFSTVLRASIIALAMVGMSAIAAENRATERARLLKENSAEFVFHLLYFGSEDKPFYRLTIAGPAAGKGLKPATFHPAAVIDEALAAKLIDHLAVEGFLNDAAERTSADDKGPRQDAPAGPCYQLIVGTTKTGLQFAQEIPLGEALIKRIHAIRQVLMTGEKPDKSWQTMTGGGWLCAACQKQPRNDQPGKCGSCGGNTTSGMLHYCGACSEKFHRCARCSLLRAGPAATGLDMLITRLVGTPNLESTK